MGGLAIQLAPAGKPLRLAWDARELPGLPSYRVEVVDSSGRLLQRQSATSAEGRLSILVGALARGQYWVRVYAPAPPSELLREFGLRVE